MHVRLPRWFGIVLAVLCAGPACAQSAIGGYTLGFVFDARSSGVKPLIGIPGAAVLGAQLDAGVPLRQAFVAPRQNYAVALTDGAALVLQFVSTTDPPAVVPLGIDSAAAGVVALSADGSAGAFYSGAEALVRIVTGLPAAPSVARTIPTAALAGTLRLLAVSNDGGTVVAAVDGDASSNLVLLDDSGNARTLAASTHVSALQFIGAGRDLLVADDADDTVSLIADAAGAAVPQLLAGAADGIAGPVGLNTSADGSVVVVANGRGANIFVFDPNGSRRDTYPCPCTPAGLARLNGNSVFLLNAPSDDAPLWLFDGDGGTPRVVFLPAGQGASAGAAQ